jgi:uncharacterized damage-inducible protein DinB
MLIPALIELFDRDLKKLEAEINSYRDEKQLWAVAGEVTNSPGNLCLHLIGNLNHFIGATLGNTGYVRNRDSEFSLQHVPKQDLLKEIHSVSEVVKNTLRSLSDADLQKEYPLEVQGRKVPTAFFLLHLTTHLSYHLGQINYHRRLLV